MNSGIKEVKFEVKWKEVDDVPPPSIGPFYTLVNYADQSNEQPKTYPVMVYVQGDLGCACPLGELQHELIFLTVHDVGTNPPNSFIKFANSPSMAYLKEKSIFLHVCIPGQEPGVSDFDGNFPSMNHLGQILSQVLEHFGLSRCIAMGEGAGADVVCRFAFANLRIEENKMDGAAWDYLMAHKLGEKYSTESKNAFIEQIHLQGLNEHNLAKYLHAFANRSDFTDQLEDASSKFDTILVTGGKSPHNKNIFHMFDRMDKAKTGLMVAEGVVDILAEAPEYLAETLSLLCQRHIHLIDEQSGPKENAKEIACCPSLHLIPPKNAPPTGRSTPLAKPAIHRDQQNVETEKKTNSAPSMTTVPQPKPSKLIGCPPAIPQNPEEYLQGKYQQNDVAFPQNPADLLPPTQLLTEQTMTKCGSSLSQLSNFQCQYCGKDCCYCHEFVE